jgi:hypothetical protein
MPALSSLYVYVLRHPDVEQAAWVRAIGLVEASTTFSSQTNMPVILSNDYGWVLFPQGRQHSKDEERPLPHWEYLLSVRGWADIKGMPEYIRALSEHRAPRRQGQAIIGRGFARSTSLRLRSIPAAAVVGSVKVFHSGYREAYPITASQMSGFQGDLGTIDIGKTALLELHVDERGESLRVGDIVKTRLKGNGSDYFVTGKVVGRPIVIDVVSIEE